MKIVITVPPIEIKWAPLTPLMEQVLGVIAARFPRPMTANEIARACGYQRGQDDGRHAHNGRAMAPAQRVIHPLIGLRSRKLVDYAPRPDRLSGTAYALTDAGRTFAAELARRHP